MRKVILQNSVGIRLTVTPTTRWLYLFYTRNSTPLVVQTTRIHLNHRIHTRAYQTKSSHDTHGVNLYMHMHNYVTCAHTSTRI